MEAGLGAVVVVVAVVVGVSGGEHDSPTLCGGGRYRPLVVDGLVTTVYHLPPCKRLHEAQDVLRVVFRGRLRCRAKYKVRCGFAARL